MLFSGTRAWITFEGPIPEREKEKRNKHSASDLNMYLWTAQGRRTLTEKTLVRKAKNKKTRSNGTWQNEKSKVNVSNHEGKVSWEALWTHVKQEEKAKGGWPREAGARGRKHRNWGHFETRTNFSQSFSWFFREINWAWSREGEKHTAYKWKRTKQSGKFTSSPQISLGTKGNFLGSKKRKLALSIKKKHVTAQRKESFGKKPSRCSHLHCPTDRENLGFCLCKTDTCMRVLS